MKRAVIMLFQLLVTAAGLWYVFHEPQRRAQIADALRHADIRWVLLGWICYSAVEILATVRWQILLRIQGICISWLRAGAIVIVGLFFNQFLPGGVGGDAMRLYFIFKQAPRNKIGATLSIAMDRLFGLLTVVFLTGMSFSLRFSWLTRSGPSRHIAYLAFILLSCSLAFVVLLFGLVNSGLLHQLPKRIPFREGIIQTGEALLRYRTHVVAMAFVFPITLVSHLAYYTSFYCAGESLRLSTYDRASLGDIRSCRSWTPSSPCPSPLEASVCARPFFKNCLAISRMCHRRLLLLLLRSVLPSRLAGDWLALPYSWHRKKSLIANTPKDLLRLRDSSARAPARSCNPFPYRPRSYGFASYRLLNGLSKGTRRTLLKPAFVHSSRTFAS
jgi:glycosyltransferase 2 family protein